MPSSQKDYGLARFSYVEVGAALGCIHEIDGEKLPAFLARLKHLQKLGFPPGTNTGKGRPAAYSFEALCQLIAALELIQIGWLPTRAVLLVTNNWRLGRITFASALVDVTGNTPRSPNRFGDSWLWLLFPESLRELTISGEKDDDYAGAVGFHRLHELETQLWKDNRDGDYAPIIGANHRVAFINITSVIRELMYQFEPIRKVDCLLEARAWLDDREAVAELNDAYLSSYRFGEDGDDGDDPET